MLQIQDILSAMDDSIEGKAHAGGQVTAEPADDGRGQSALSGPFLSPAKEDLVEEERQLLEQVWHVT